MHRNAEQMSDFLFPREPGSTSWVTPVLIITLHSHDPNLAHRLLHRSFRFHCHVPFTQSGLFPKPGSQSGCAIAEYILGASNCFWSCLTNAEAAAPTYLTPLTSLRATISVLAVNSSKTQRLLASSVAASLITFLRGYLAEHVLLYTSWRSRG
ncbi:uncharacterized protein K460DRAFT_155707 [Cucurbitaria berberidis CBS 394.84]|uniref:Uncharacterized protein n=1 Tax=Cucurbitaria berberidis CBS 394.84 TaxID=1168544 RepID=A0A9P4GEW2_9PLEO|nr:uncharacterized protein K460DRAFT_155707 [Cucurbitaria berberidis CBS 394.84]KAF1844001.1 hypothetical protein K460DRAFT_155707 [Cucurbitaria berberidis CBS 394.84]